MESEIILSIVNKGFSIRINQPGLIASSFKFDEKRNAYYCISYELIAGRWEGFTSVRKKV